MLREEFVNRIASDYAHKDIKMCSDSLFSWNPKTRVVNYDLNVDKFFEGYLIHEISHAILGHSLSSSDIRLLEMEAEAWEQTESICHKYQIKLDYEEIQGSMNTYREWLFKRSTCPICSVVGIQIDKNTYCCTQCYTEWAVGKNVFNRCYRKSILK